MNNEVLVIGLVYFIILVWKWATKDEIYQDCLSIIKAHDLQFFIDRMAVITFRMCQKYDVNKMIPFTRFPDITMGPQVNKPKTLTDGKESITTTTIGTFTYESNHIWLEEQRHKAEMIFTAAHELGHMLDKYKTYYPKGPNGWHWRTYLDKETQAWTEAEVILLASLQDLTDFDSFMVAFYKDRDETMEVVRKQVRLGK